jgi:hypothetical protein
LTGTAGVLGFGVVFSALFDYWLLTLTFDWYGWLWLL